MNPESEVIIIDYKISDGAPARIGDTLTVHYKVALSSDQLQQGPWIDSSWEKQPILFILGKGEVLKGIDIGLENMLNASTRKLIIPPHLAFGEKGIPGLIPPNTTLYFEIYLSNIKKA